MTMTGLNMPICGLLFSFFVLFAYRIAAQRPHSTGEPMIRERYSTPI